MKLKGTTKCNFYWQYTDGVMQGSSITLNHIIESFLEKIDKAIKENGDVEREYTKNLFINDKHYNNTDSVKMDLKVSLRHNQDIIWFKTKYDVKEDCTVEEIYNAIADIAEFYAYEMDTDTDNIKITVKQFEIKET